MTSSEVIDVALRTFHVLGWTYLRLSIGPVLFCLAALAFISEFALPGLFETSNVNNWVAQIQEAGMAVFLSLFVGGPLFLIGVSSVTAGVTQLVSDYMLGNVPDERAARRAMARAMPRLFALSIREVTLSFSGVLVAIALLMITAAISKLFPDSVTLSGLIALVGVIAFIPAIGIFVYVRIVHALAPVVLVLENLPAKAAAKRSRYLVNTSDLQGTGQGALIGLFFLCGLIVMLLWAGYSAAIGMLDLSTQVQQIANNLPMPGLLMSAFGLLPLFLSLWLILPLWAATVTVLYYDRRIRLEGFDIEALAGDVWRADQATRFQL